MSTSHVSRPSPLRRRLAYAVVAACTLISGAAASPAEAGGDHDRGHEHAAIDDSSAYRPISPIRVVDSREGRGTPKGRIGADQYIQVQVVPASVSTAAGVNRSDVTAVALNVTATNTAAGGFVTVYPGDATVLPPVSSLNMMRAGHTIANLVTTPVAADGSVKIYAVTATDIVVDVQGVFVETGSARQGRLELLDTPHRLFDTRDSGRRLNGGDTITADLGAQVPKDATAAVVNLTATRTSSAGFITVFPAGQANRPLASNVNINRADETIPNQAYVALSDAKFQIYSHSALDLIVDVVGYYTGTAAPDSSEGLFVPVTPYRMLDTRNAVPQSNFTTRPMRTDETGFLPVTGRGGVPSVGVAAVAANATVTEPAAPGFVRLWPAGAQMPATSSVNADYANHTVANHAVTAVGTSGAAIYTSTPTHVIFDVTGYWTGTPVTPTGPTNPPPPTAGGYTAIHLNSDGSPVRWDPCDPIGYKTNFSTAQPQQVAAFERALAKAEAATGLDFVAEGTFRGGVDAVNTSGSDVYFGVYDRNTPAVGGASGFASVEWSWTGSGPAWIDGGHAAIARDHTDELIAEQVWLHEIGHLVGLGHVDDPNQIMYPILSFQDTEYADGDLAGLRAVGATQGCRTQF